MSIFFTTLAAIALLCVTYFILIVLGVAIILSFAGRKARQRLAMGMPGCGLVASARKDEPRG